MTLGELVKNPKGFKITGIYRISRFEVKTAKNGKAYGDFQISDLSCDVPAKYWDISAQVTALLSQHAILQIEATLDYYKDAPQLTVVGITIPSPEAIDQAIKNLGMMSMRDLDEMLAWIVATINKLENDALRQVLTYFFVTRIDFAQQFQRHPAAVRNHHAWIGGLLEHSVEVVESALAYCARRDKVNQELLIAAALLHDIGKVREIEVDALGLPVGFTKEGKLLGHIYLGMEMVEQACREVGATQEIGLLLKHCIFSHHGQADWGSPVEPMIVEAEILHYLDNLSAKTDMFSREEERAEVGGFVRSHSLRRDVYRPRL